MYVGRYVVLLIQILIALFPLTICHLSIEEEGRKRSGKITKGEDGEKEEENEERKQKCFPLDPPGTVNTTHYCKLKTGGYFFYLRI